jgi:hypothetical protein
VAGTFGTLRKDSYFTPSALLDEATALDSAVRLLGATAFNDNANVDADTLAAWNAFVGVWRSFWAECNAWDGWVFRAENSTRDELLDYEGQFVSFKGQFANAGTDTSDVPDPTAEGSRTVDSISSAVSGAGAVLQKFSWQLIAGAAIVVGGAVVLLMAARRGGLPV